MYLKCRKVKTGVWECWQHVIVKDKEYIEQSNGSEVLKPVYRVYTLEEYTALEKGEPPYEQDICLSLTNAKNTCWKLYCNSAKRKDLDFPKLADQIYKNDNTIDTVYKLIESYYKTPQSQAEAKIKLEQELNQCYDEGTIYRVNPNYWGGDK